MDRDGDVDVVFNFGRDVWVRLNDGQARFEPVYHATPFSGLDELSLADLDRDGQLDILSPVPATSARAGQPASASLTSLHPPTGTEYYEEVDQMPSAVGNGEVQAAMQKRLVVPHGYTSTRRARPTAWNPSWEQTAR